MNTKQQALSVAEAIEGVSIVTGLSTSVVREVLLTASSKDLREVKNALGSIALLMMHAGHLVSPKLEAALYVASSIKLLLGDLGPRVDLTELAEEVEAREHQANLETIKALEKAAAPDPVEHIGEIKLRKPKFGDTVEIVNSPYYGMKPGDKGVAVETDVASWDFGVVPLDRGEAHLDVYGFNTADLKLAA